MIYALPMSTFGQSIVTCEVIFRRSKGKFDSVPSTSSLWKWGPQWELKLKLKTFLSSALNAGQLLALLYDRFTIKRNDQSTSTI